MDPALVIETHNLQKSYGSVRALRGLDLEVRQGEIYGFLGPNGAGKTTTIRCLLDLIHPNGGTARVLGMDPQREPVAVRARVGYLPGELHLEENLSVEAVLRYFNSLRGGKASWPHLKTLCERLGLSLKTATKNLSKGNKQKVGVVQALMHQPELLLLDEPTSGLDPLAQQEVLGMVAEARQAGASVFFSSHNLAEVEEIADRVGIIRRGQLVEVAETQALTQRAVQRVRVRFKTPVDLSRLQDIVGLVVLSSDGAQDVTLQVEGDMDALVKALAAFPISRLETQQPSLEEVFLAYYQEEPISQRAQRTDRIV